MKKVNIFGFYLLLLILIFVTVGCGVNSPIIAPDDSVAAQEKPDETEGPSDLSSAAETPLASAKEINRSSEDYNYEGWVEGFPAPDICMFVDSNWEYDNSANLWKDPQNKEAELAYKPLYGVTISAKEAILEDYGAIIEKGGDVSYGEFSSKYLAEAYYCKYIENEIAYIHLYFFFYPRDIDPDKGVPILMSLSYKSRADITNSAATLNEDAFWKAAQSIYISKSYIKYIPYIPAVDGDNTSDGSNQGVVP